MNAIDAEQILEAILMWIIAGTYFTGMVLAYRLRFHLDVEKMACPDGARRSIRYIAFPPQDLLTDKGKKRRRTVVVLWLVGLLSFLILIIWKI